MAYKFHIRAAKSGEYRTSFEYNGEKIFWTEGYNSKASAQIAIDSEERSARRNRRRKLNLSLKDLAKVPFRAGIFSSKPR